LKVQSGSRTWDDGSTLDFTALSAAESNDLSLDCVVIDSSAASHDSSWKAQQCSDSAKTICTGTL